MITVVRMALRHTLYTPHFGCLQEFAHRMSCHGTSFGTIKSVNQKKCHRNSDLRKSSQLTEEK